MKKTTVIITAIILSLLTAAVMPAQVFADALPEYISEVKVYQGSYADAAAEGFTILSDDKGNPVDLNQGSGATGVGAKGNKKVYLGYKTTTKRSEAITDLALMNMKGGYSVEEYDALMADQMKEQIVPFVERFMAAVEEYRENYASAVALNQKRAQYVHDALNKLTDDDCGGAGLGDLLLNETVYEMAKPEYDALSEKEKEKTSLYDVNNKVRDSLPESEKNSHADILTIIAQSNGQATLLMEGLVTRAADTNEDTWFDRFAGLTYENLVDETGLAPSDADTELAKMFDDDAREILGMWEEFKKLLDNYDEAVKTLEEETAKDLSAENEIVDNYDFETATDEEIEAYALAVEKIRKHSEIIANCENDILVHKYLEATDYEDGTMLDYFTQDYETVRDDMTIIYPLVASLSEGQRSGLEFVTLEDMVLLGITDEQGYKNAKLDELEPASIYLGVNRELYQKGGVALTSDALRSDVKDVDIPDKNISLAIFGGLAAGFALLGGFAFAASYTARNMILKSLADYNAVIEEINTTIYNNVKGIIGLNRMVSASDSLAGGSSAEAATRFQPLIEKHEQAILNAKTELEQATDIEFEARMAQRSANCKSMMIGTAIFTVVMVAISATLLYLDYKAMKDYYKVDFTPIPHYMVDEKDIVVYNDKNEKIVIKNQSAYYKAVECNRKKGDSYFDDIGTCADMNGCVNPQWLALYAQKSDTVSPILASSLKVVVGIKSIPAGYTTGIHMFGEDSAFNLNSERYCWNSGAKSVFVYYKSDTSTSSSASAAGSNFTGGTVALAGVGGLALGALISGIAVTAADKKKSKKAA